MTKEKDQVAPLSSVNLALLDLGVVLGQTQAFGMVAGRCTAAQALGLKRLRELTRVGLENGLV